MRLLDWPCVAEHLSDCDLSYLEFQLLPFGHNWGGCPCTLWSATVGWLCTLVTARSPVEIKDLRSRPAACGLPTMPWLKDSLDSVLSSLRGSRKPRHVKGTVQLFRFKSNSRGMCRFAWWLRSIHHIAPSTRIMPSFPTFMIWISDQLPIPKLWVPGEFMLLVPNCAVS